MNFVSRPPALDQHQLEAFLREEFPQMFQYNLNFSFENVGYGSATVGMVTNKAHLRPGNTVSGPTMMMLTDVAAYAAVLTGVGPVALAVTSSLNINFLRKPEGGQLYCICKPVKIGKTLCIMDAKITGADKNESRAYSQATVTYALPQNK